MVKIKRAIISVSNKTGIVDFSKALAEYGIEILSTGGTASVLRSEGLTVEDVSEITGFPEMLDGRIKTLHPRIHGGILAVRDNPEHMKELEDHAIVPIDMVVVNLYPFEDTVAKEGVTLDEAIENIDIGGPTMLRSAAKNYRDAAVVVDPDDYASILDELKARDGALSQGTRFRLAVKVFQLTSKYDEAIASYLEKEGASI